MRHVACHMVLIKMKPLEKILTHIRSLPEKTRRLLAGLFLIAAAILLFVSWSITIPSRLTSLSGNSFVRDNTNVAARIEGASAISPATPSPAEGVIESLGTVFKAIVPEVNREEESRTVFSRIEETAGYASAMIIQAFDTLLNYAESQLQ